MTKNPDLPQGYITLKEAAKLSGYAPDYVGQLIRKGRISGRQIYYNTAWVTTEGAIKEYLDREAGAKENDGLEAIPEDIGDRFQQLKNRLLSEVRLLGIVQLLLYIGLALSLIFAIFLFYILSVNVEHVLDRRATERALQNTERSIAPQSLP